MKTAYLVGAGDFTPRGFTPKGQDLVIAADGGAFSLLQQDIRPHVLVGDMDSLAHRPRGVASLRFPVSKDDTDLALALKLAQARGYTRLKIYGALGGRMDHSLANLQLLAACAQAGLRTMLVDKQLTAFSLHNGSLLLPPVAPGIIVSVFSWGDVALGVSLSGLAYPLVNASLSCTLPLGVSNRGLGRPVKISVQQGTLLILVMQPQA